MSDSDELKTLRRRVAEQRKEIARLHAERDLAWECDTIKTQYWRSMQLSSSFMRHEQFVLRGRRVLGVIVRTTRFGPTMWYASHGAGLADNTATAISEVVKHDTLTKSITGGSTS